jgi:hypothetical protein
MEVGLGPNWGCSAKEKKIMKFKRAHADMFPLLKEFSV